MFSCCYVLVIFISLTFQFPSINVSYANGTRKIEWVCLSSFLYQDYEWAKRMEAKENWERRSVVCVNLVDGKRRHWAEHNHGFSHVQERRSPS
jgi:hypothetical protein